MSTLKEKITSIGLTLILMALVVLPKFVALTIVVLLIFLIATLFDNTRGEKKIIFRYNQLYISGLFFLYLFGLTYSSNLDFGFKEIEARLSFLIAPIIFIIIGFKKIHLNMKTITIGFVSICIVSSLLSIRQGFSCIGTQNDFYYDCFSGSLMAYKIHINYLSIYYFMAILMLWYVFRNSILLIFLKIIISGWLIYFIYLFDSLGCWVAITITLASLLLYFIFKIKNTSYKISLLLGFFILTFFSSYFVYKELNESYQNNYRYIQSKKELYQIANETHESILARIVVWDIALQEILKHPFGVGTGDVKDHLIQQYRDHGLDNLAKIKLNPHNQFLQTGVAIGWLGIIVLFVLQIGLIYKGFSQKNWLLIAFATLCFINMMFESYLERQAGIIFFSIFIFLLDNTFGCPVSKGNQKCTEKT